MRVVAWFSCGGPSAVNAKLSVDLYDAEVVYCDTLAEEHPDNRRFMKDVQQWIGKPIHTIKSEKYNSPSDVFEARKYMAGIAGAPCTVELKKVPRLAFQRPDDVHTFGYHLGEEGRIEVFEKNNHELNLKWPLIEKQYDKKRCLLELENAGIKLPVMYKLGFEHNNCIACVKATSPKYWNMVRHNFPGMYQKRSEQSRRIGARLVRIDGERRFLDELRPDNEEDLFEDISCGPHCGEL